MSRSKRLTDAQRMEIVREAASGVSTSVLAQRFGVTLRAVQYTVKSDAERQRDTAVPVLAVSVKVTSDEMAAFDADRKVAHGAFHGGNQVDFYAKTMAEHPAWVVDAIAAVGASSNVTDEQPLQIEQNMNLNDQNMSLFGMGPPSGVHVPQAPMAHNSGVSPSMPSPNHYDASTPSDARSPTRMSIGRSSMRMSLQQAQRNPSVLSYGNGLRHMSMTSETTFGRAMSGLSALSIDWENLDDFDLDVDHSAHINNNSNGVGGGNNNGSKDNGGLRSSFRCSFVAPGSNPNNQQDDAHVSFKV